MELVGRDRLVRDGLTWRPEQRVGGVWNSTDRKGQARQYRDGNAMNGLPRLTLADYDRLGESTTI